MNTRDFSKFGYREIKMARDLLAAYIDKNETRLLGGGIAVELNPMSGNVFLVDEDCNVAMCDDDVLVDFISCPECGHEGLVTEFLDGGENDCCKSYLAELEIPIYEGKTK